MKAFDKSGEYGLKLKLSKRMSAAVLKFGQSGAIRHGTGNCFSNAFYGSDKLLKGRQALVVTTGWHLFADGVGHGQVRPCPC